MKTKWKEDAYILHIFEDFKIQFKTVRNWIRRENTRHQTVYKGQFSTRVWSTLFGKNNGFALVSFDVFYTIRTRVTRSHFIILKLFLFGYRLRS